MTQQEMDELQKAIYGDKPMTTSNSRGPIDSLPVVVCKIDLPEVKPPCVHDWGSVYDDYNGVYKCKKCGKYSA